MKLQNLPQLNNCTKSMKLKYQQNLFNLQTDSKSLTHPKHETPKIIETKIINPPTIQKKNLTNQQNENHFAKLFPLEKVQNSLFTILISTYM